MTSLRERQKEDRRNRILAAAQEMFARTGYETTTVEAIAEAAGVSSMTVYNYYGTKSGVLLALVAESDRVLLQKIALELFQDLPELVHQFSAIIRRHAISYLDRAVWRQVIAASIVEANSRFAKSYHTLDRQLALALTGHIKRLQEVGKIAPAVSALDLGRALFYLQNMRFIQFISSDEMTEETVSAWLRDDVRALMNALPRGEHESQPSSVSCNDLA